ncbi:MAG: tripartite tricarboxylate transporter substrate binding protein [Rhizobiales bacterium]|nr:tripartite tricarboxylate transporter substrate binding protein [Hyphomicrobiales bacterium]
MARLAALFAALFGLAAQPSPAAAQAFPQRPVQILVPFAAGGAVDVIARTLADALARSWGQQPVVDNRPGAGGQVASQALVRSAPDGHTLLIVASGHPLNQFFYPRLAYDTFADFTPITQIASSPLVIAVNAKDAAPDLKRFLEGARGRPGGLNYGVSGFGTSAHLAGLLVASSAGVELTPIPHRSGTQALQSVISGDLPMSINPLAEVLGQVQSGLVRPIAVTSAVRSPALPNAPTVAEAGYPGFEAGVWWGVLAPANLPADLKARLHKDIVAALAEPNVRRMLETIGATPVGSSPAEFDAYMRAEAAKWGPVIRAANVRIE